MKEQIDIFDDLLIEFDEMGFVPTNFLPDHDSEYYAIDWKNRLINAFAGYRKQSEKYLIKENGDILPLTHQSEWISVEDRLPEIETTGKGWGDHRVDKSVRVLCVCKQKSGKVLVKEGYYELFDFGHNPSWRIPGSIDSVTHWMPLPEPPKMKGE